MIRGLRTGFFLAKKHGKMRLRSLEVLELESRLTPAAPVAPVIIEPFAEGQTTGTFDINMQTNPDLYSDPDGHAWQATDWVIREQSSGTTVWQVPFTSAPPLTLYRVDFSDGQFVGPLLGKTELNYNTNYQLVVRYRDANNEVSPEAVRNFKTASASSPVPGAGTWLVRPGYVVEPVQTGLRLPVNVAFVPNPGTNPSDPLYYVTELYGSIKVVRRDGTMSTFATGLLDYNPQGPISGSGEQGLTGIAVERDSVDPNIYHLYVGMLWDNGSPPGGPNHYPKVERITSASGGLTMATRTVLRNMQPETQGQSHQISNITIGPDNKLYVHMGDGFDSSTGLNLNQYRGKILRMNKNGTPVATGDPAGANPFYNAADGITATDYIWVYGHRNPFGGAWRPSDNKHWVVENGNSLDRMVDVSSGQNMGWNGSDSTLVANSKFIWNPATAPVNIAFVDGTLFGGSGFPTEAYDHAYVSLSGSTYASGVSSRGAKSIVEFPDMDTLGVDGKLAVQPSFLVKYNGTGRSTVSGLAAGPDGLYFTDLYEETGVGGATGVGGNVWRVRYVGTSGGQVPTVATPAAATPNPVNSGITANLSVLGADDAGESPLTYTWGVQGSPPAAVSFSVNGTNAAKNSVATFAANGTYELVVIIRDTGGQAVLSNVTVVVTSVPTGSGNGLRGTYYDNIDFTGASVVRIDPTVNFDWGNGAPISGIGADTFSVRWTGYVQPRYSETYTFSITTDDGMRLWVNNQLIIDQFIDQGPTTHTGTIALTAGVPYAIRIDYYENGGGAVAQLRWQSAAQPLEVIPTSQIYGPTGAPNAPSGLAAVPYNGNRIDLSWNNNAALPNLAEGYLVEQSPNGTSGWTQIASVAGTSFSATGLSSATPYFFRVRAFNALGNSAFTSVIGAVTGTVGSTINYPSDFSNVPAGGALTFVGGASVVNNRLRLTSGGTNQARAVYATNQQDITAFQTTFTHTHTGSADGITFVLHRDPRGLTALGASGGALGYTGITPSFAFAMNIFGSNTYGSSFTTNGAAPGNYTQSNGVNWQLDNTPINVTITYLGGTTLTVTLRQGANTETKTFTFASTLAALLGGNLATVGFTASTGSSTSTQEITNWVFSPLSAPAAPTGLQAELSGYGAGSQAAVAIGNELTWNAAPGAASYRIERKLGVGGTFAEIGFVTATTFADSNLAPGSAYIYRVRGVNAVGNGAYSAELTVNTPVAPAAPTAGEVTATTQTSISLRWLDNASNEGGFQIFRSNGDEPFALIGSVPASAAPTPAFVTFTDSGLTVGVSYHYEVRAFNLSGASSAATASAIAANATTTSLIATPQATTGGSLVQFTATVAPSPGNFGTVSFFDNGVAIPGGTNVPISGGVAIFSTSSLSIGSHPVTATFNGFTGFLPSTSNTQTVQINGPPTLLSTTLNGATPELLNLPGALANQRSMIRSFQLTFDMPVTLSAGAVDIAPTGTLGVRPAIITLLNTSGGSAAATTWNVTFGGAGTAGGSVADGRYELLIDPTKVVSSAGVALPAAPPAYAFHRLFGDMDGNATVNNVEIVEVRRNANTTSASPSFLWLFDHDWNGTIANTDILEVRRNANRTV
jgi:glucose/arabinose dehydrogenase